MALAAQEDKEPDLFLTDAGMSGRGAAAVFCSVLLGRFRSPLARGRRLFSETARAGPWAMPSAASALPGGNCQGPNQVDPLLLPGKAAAGRVVAFRKLCLARIRAVSSGVGAIKRPPFSATAAKPGQPTPPPHKAAARPSTPWPGRVEEDGLEISLVLPKPVEHVARQDRQTRAFALKATGLPLRSLIVHAALSPRTSEFPRRSNTSRR